MVSRRSLVKYGKNLGFSLEKPYSSVFYGILFGVLFFFISTIIGIIFYYFQIIDPVSGDVSNTTMIVESIPNYWLLGLILSVSAIVEELFFRGLMLSIISKKHNYILGIVVTSLLFSLAHIGYNMLYTSLWALVFGFYLGFIMYRFRNLFIPMFTHISYNIIILLTIALYTIDTGF